MKLKYILLIIGIILILIGVIMYKQQLIQVKNISQEYLKGFLEDWTIPITQSNPEILNYKVEINNGLKISYKEDYSVTFIPYFVLTNNNTLTWNQIPTNIEKDLWKIKIDDTHYKYGVNFNKLTTAQKNLIQYVVLHRSNSTGLTWDDVQLEGNTIIIKNKIYISHNDILATYTIPMINKTDIVIGGLNNNWTECIEWNETDCINEIIVFNWKSNGDGTWNISFDPTITIQNGQVTSGNLVNITAETNFTHLNISTTAPYDSLVGYWNFDGDKDNTLLTKHYDWSKHNNDGTGNGNVIVNNTNCIYGDCANFDGNGDYVSVPYQQSHSKLCVNGCSFSAWIYKADANTESIISRWDNSGNNNFFSFLIDSGFDTNFRIEDDGTDSGGICIVDYTGSDIVVNTWTHVVAVYNLTSAIIYKNGAYGTLATCTQTINATAWQDNEPTMIGMRDDGSLTEDWNGTIDEVMIFNTSLTQAQILDIYNNQSARFMPTGTQDIVNQTYMNISTGNNRVNVITWTESLLGSSINLSVGYYNTSWFYTDPQVVVSGIDLTYTISNASTNLTLNYTFYAGNSTNPFYSPIIKDNITIDVWNEAEGDTIYPLFSTYWDDNGSLLDTGTGKFNVTVENTNGTVYLNINGSKITAKNMTANVYNATYNFGIAGTYLYNWTAYGNGTSNNLNTSINRYYTVNSSVSNCWTKTGSGRGSILYIPRGCVYQVNKGETG